MATELASCPKCGTQRKGEAACPKCGLTGARMDQFAQERDATVPDVLTTAWERTLEAWDDTSRHDEVMRLVAQHDAYAWAAARYRTRTGDAIGARQLERVRKAAEATLYATASVRAETSPKPYRALTAVLVMLILAAVAGVLYAMIVHDKAENRQDATPASPAMRSQQPVKPLQPLLPRTPAPADDRK